MYSAMPRPWNSCAAAMTARSSPLWLGHESVETTQVYLHADMAMKEKALSTITPMGVKPARFQPNDMLLAFLEAL